MCIGRKAAARTSASRSPGTRPRSRPPATSTTSSTARCSLPSSRPRGSRRRGPRQTSTTWTPHASSVSSSPAATLLTRSAARLRRSSRRSRRPVSPPSGRATTRTAMPMAPSAPRAQPVGLATVRGRASGAARRPAPRAPSRAPWMTRRRREGPGLKTSFRRPAVYPTMPWCAGVPVRQRATGRRTAECCVAAEDASVAAAAAFGPRAPTWTRLFSSLLFSSLQSLLA
mmetsp:Transcript_21390/g.68164  ORF Transcript_21390/g.68164 Transcript_21390/m.68164 type:complete len:228 (+) Transcript_21390:1083-1766(+)